MDIDALKKLYESGALTREEFRAAVGWTEHECRRITEHWTTKDGERIAWADLETRHLWNIARLLVRVVRDWQSLCDNSDFLRADWLRRMERAHAHMVERHPERVARITAQRDRFREIIATADLTTYRNKTRGSLVRSRREFACAVDELSYRGVLPTWDDLRVAWDRACAAGAVDDPERRPWCLIELWVGFSGEPTTSAEWEARQACSG